MFVTKNNTEKYSNIVEIPRGKVRMSGKTRLQATLAALAAVEIRYTMKINLNTDFTELFVLEEEGAGSLIFVIKQSFQKK